VFAAVAWCHDRTDGKLHLLGLLMTAFFNDLESLTELAIRKPEVRRLKTCGYRAEVLIGILHRIWY
ncbi:MAG TPA: hypothetical protein VFG50_05430, partial [Rhodothermales bacterium]|nr:hypothetical protein [Rhodothermales bacterium]